jgi:hypothetical protein
MDDVLPTTATTTFSSSTNLSIGSLNNNNTLFTLVRDIHSSSSNNNSNSPTYIDLKPGSKITIGRQLCNDVVLTSSSQTITTNNGTLTSSVSTISRIHAIIYVDQDNVCCVRDNNSTNGTLVNGTRILKSTDYILQIGDRISFAVPEYSYILNYNPSVNTDSTMNKTSNIFIPKSLKNATSRLPPIPQLIKTTTTSPILVNDRVESSFTHDNLLNNMNSTNELTSSNTNNITTTNRSSSSDIENKRIRIVNSSSPVSDSSSSVSNSSSNNNNSGISMSMNPLISSDLISSNDWPLLLAKEMALGTGSLYYNRIVDSSSSPLIDPLRNAEFKYWIQYEIDILEIESTKAVRDGNGRFESNHFHTTTTATTTTTNSNNNNINPQTSLLESSTSGHQIVKSNLLQTSAQYGRAECALVELMISLGQIDSSSRFCDLGSGIGTVCLQVCAVTRCKVFGVELMPGRFETALQLRDLFLKFAEHKKWSSPTYNDIMLLNGDFTTKECIQRARVCDVFWVNNAKGIFHNRCSNASSNALDWYVALIAAGTRLGSRIICLDSVSELDCNPLCQAFKKQVYQSPPNAVSWSKLRVPVYVYTKIRNEWTCPRCGVNNTLILDHHGERIQDRCLTCAEAEGGMSRSMYLLRRGNR